MQYIIITLTLSVGREQREVHATYTHLPRRVGERSSAIRGLPDALYMFCLGFKNINQSRRRKITEEKSDLLISR